MHSLSEIELRRSEGAASLSTYGTFRFHILFFIGNPEKYYSCMLL